LLTISSTRARLRVADLPLHGEALAHGGEFLAHGVGVQAVRHREVHAQEEQLGVLVPELLRVLDVAAALEQESRHVVHDAGRIGAGERQDVIVVLHGEVL